MTGGGIIPSKLAYPSADAFTISYSGAMIETVTGETLILHIAVRGTPTFLLCTLQLLKLYSKAFS